VENCISFDTGIAAINAETCIECDRCVFVCPVNVIIPLREAHPRSLRREK
jgi:Fe-S-cluster-containing hydrogenase component 2